MYDFLVFTMWKNRTSPNRRQNKAFKNQTALPHPLFEPYWSAGKKSAIIVLINQWHKTMVSAFFPRFSSRFSDPMDPAQLFFRKQRDPDDDFLISRKQDNILPNKWHSQSVEDTAYTINIELFSISIGM
ncbi:Uncharacterized protein APZ42_001984 [Daphnia magna]|uniref:Uncharacterized protein n=1 Tax=Daphnia magna TaxID=35525 RepID=A0A162C691_9CRUS|nr:Uncharacterized protein APZ42_001984 [Daphnia magna]